MTVEDVCTQNLTATHGLYEQEICMVAENPRHSKRNFLRRR